MTHGHIAICGQQDDTHHLYTNHDGQTGEILTDLAELPFLIHRIGFDLLDRCIANKPKNSCLDVRFCDGPGYPLYMADLLESPVLNAERYQSVQDVYRTFRCHASLNLYAGRLAGYIVAMRFDRWQVIVKKSQISYSKRPAIVVFLSDTGYVLRKGADVEPEYWMEYLGEALAAVAERQQDIPEDCRVQLIGEHIHVPYTGILAHLFFAEVKQRAAKYIEQQSKTTHHNTAETER